MQGEGVGEKLIGSGEYLGLVTLYVELEEDVAVGGEQHVVEATDWDFFFVKVLGGGSGGEVRVEHGKDGAGEGVGRNIDFDLAIGGSEGHAVGDVPERICRGGLKKAGVRGGGGFEGDDLALVAGRAALMSELTGVGADIDDEIDLELGEEEVVAKLLRGVDAGLSDLKAGGFGEGTQDVFDG